MLGTMQAAHSLWAQMVVEVEGEQGPVEVEGEGGVPVLAEVAALVSEVN